MSRITIMCLPHKGQKKYSVSLNTFYLKLLIPILLLTSGIIGFLTVDYLHLLEVKDSFHDVQRENKHLKGEAQVLLVQLTSVKKSLQNIETYTSKLNKMVNLQVNSVGKKTGIGPLTREEFASVEANAKAQGNFMPLGINLSKLTFQPTFTKLDEIQRESTHQAIELQKLLSTLSRKQTLLSSIPTVLPVRGWLASNYGKRISPFTGKKTFHRGLDIAAAMGTPIRAPADGVVIFSGAKVGFGNFVMIAHYESGIVTKYGHNAENMVYVGQKVLRGDQIASVGMTGRTTGPHLHYEISVNGKTVNPRNFVLNRNARVF